MDPIYLKSWILREDCLILILFIHIYSEQLYVIELVKGHFLREGISPRAISICTGLKYYYGLN